ncbi:MAG: leucine-rich repeat protein [Clostridia bacterium]|nr:leucine-rich repeat protein [Clostridia bacterium]
MKKENVRRRGRTWLWLAVALCLIWPADADQVPAGGESTEPDATVTAAEAWPPVPGQAGERETPEEEETPGVTQAPTEEPPAEPASDPTVPPEAEPTSDSQEDPTEGPTEEPTPDAPPADEPTPGPSEPPAETVTPEQPATEPPAETPTGEPTETPTGEPTETPTGEPTETPTGEPTETPAVTPAFTVFPGEYTVDDAGVLIAYAGSRDIETLEDLPEGIRAIGPHAFERLRELKTVVLPDSVEEIREMAFADCPNLETVVIGEESRLNKLFDGAFSYCYKLQDRGFAEGKEWEGDPFAGIPEMTPTPTPTPTAVPDDGDGEETSDGDGEDTADGFLDGIEWEVPAVSTSRGTGAKKPKHTKPGTKVTHGYDQVTVGIGETAPMQELTLGGETLPLSLKGENDEAAAFTAAFAVGDTIWDGTAATADLVDTLILKAAEEPGNRWEINGAVLRRLNKTGIDFILFRDETEDVIVPTEGFLAGRAYDGMKSRGVAGRRFDYTLITGGAVAWKLTVEGEDYDLNEDPKAPIYLTGITVIPKDPETEKDGRTQAGTAP